MTELMRDNSLQFIARKMVEATPRNGNNGIAGGIARRKRIDGGLAFQHIHLGDRHAGGNRNFLDDVDEAAVFRVTRVGIDQHAAHVAGHFATTTGPQTEAAIQARECDKSNRRQACHDHQPQVVCQPVTVGKTQDEVFVSGTGCNHGDNKVNRSNNAHYGNNEEQDQIARISARPVLMLEKVHEPSERNLRCLPLLLGVDLEELRQREAENAGKDGVGEVFTGGVVGHH